jgi:hypothetical protein
MRTASRVAVHAEALFGCFGSLFLLRHRLQPANHYLGKLLVTGIIGWFCRLVPPRAPVFLQFLIG